MTLSNCHIFASHSTFISALVPYSLSHNCIFFITIGTLNCILFMQIATLFPTLFFHSKMFYSLRWRQTSSGVCWYNQNLANINFFITVPQLSCKKKREMIQMTNFIIDIFPTIQDERPLLQSSREAEAQPEVALNPLVPLVDPERSHRAGASEWLTPPKLDNPHLLVQLLLSDYCKKEWELNYASLAWPSRRRQCSERTSSQYSLTELWQANYWPTVVKFSLHRSLGQCN